jgi:chemotaxis protein CheD
MRDISVHMGELAVSADPAAVLVSIGLGSCIGLALVDAGAGVAGLAHILLPGPGDAERRSPGTFAHSGVPALVRAVTALGARDLSAVIVGGAHMFGADAAARPRVGERNVAARTRVGERNVAAVRAALDAAGIAIVAADTGGDGGRTIRVYLDRALVTARITGGTETALLGCMEVAA